MLELEKRLFGNWQRVQIVGKWLFDVRVASQEKQQQEQQRSLIDSTRPI